MSLGRLQGRSFVAGALVRIDQVEVSDCIENVFYQFVLMGIYAHLPILALLDDMFVFLFLDSRIVAALSLVRGTSAF